MRRAGHRGLRGHRVGRLRRHAERLRPTSRPTVVYVFFWVAIPFGTLLVGDFFSAFNPWRATARAAAWVYVRARRGGEPPTALAYPPWLGRWPAALGILGFAWVELVYVNKDDPSQLATMALVYAAIQLVGMSFYGIEPWARNADAFGALLPPLLDAVAAALARRGRCTCVRRCPARPTLDAGPGHRCPALHDDRHRQLRRPLPGRDLDGPGRHRSLPAAALHQRRLQRRGGARDHLHHRAADHGGIDQRPVSPRRDRHAQSIGRHGDASELSRRFVHSLIPIALAYVVAHYFSLLALPGPGDGLSRLRPARPRLEPLRHRHVHDRLQPRRRQRRLVRAGLRAGRSATWPASRSPTTAPSSSTTARATRPARSTGCLRSWSPSPASGSGSCPPRPMTTLPLAHAGHWYQAMLYLAPVLIVVVVLWVQERRERRRDDSDEDERRSRAPTPRRARPRACGCRGPGRGRRAARPGS